MQRILSLDLARGFTVLAMPSVHVVMLYSKPDVQRSLPGVLLQFIAEGPGAQLFMLLMGASICFSKSITARKVFQRTIILWAGGFLLNYFKFVIPLELGILPPRLLADFPLSEIQFLLMGDIFHFAGIAYPITYLVSRIKNYPGIAMMLAIAIMALSPYTWDVKTNLIFVDQFLVYFNGQPPSVFFPVFPWLLYPLTGLAMGPFIQSGKLAVPGAILIILSLILPATPEGGSFYRTLPADTIFHAAIILLWLSLFHYFAKKIKNNFIFTLLSFCSRNISSIYIIQWLLIFWLLPFAGYQRLGLLHSFYWMTAITLTTLLLSYALKKNL